MGSRAHLYVEPRLPGWWDRLIILLTLASIAVVLTHARLEGDVEATRLVLRVDLAMCSVFLADFAWRLSRANQRWTFLRRNWVDLLGSIPLIEPLRIARVVRLVRLVRVLRIVAMSRRVLNRYDIRTPPAVRYLVLVTAAIWVLAGFGFYSFEGGANQSVDSFYDALWWSMTTLSTVGYGDLYPTTAGGRVVAIATMVLGVGVLGTLAGTLATGFMEARERVLSGKRSYVMRDHLLVLGWNDNGPATIAEFRGDPRFAEAGVVVVAELPRTPVDDRSVKFVGGSPALRDSLERASAARAGAALVLARDPKDPQSDMESAVVIGALRRLNADVPVAAQLVDAKHHQLLREAGADTAINSSLVVGALLVRSVQHVGSYELVMDLLSSADGSEFYRVPVPPAFIGKQFRDYAREMIEQSVSVVALARKRELLMNPAPECELLVGDEAFVVARHAPK